MLLGSFGFLDNDILTENNNNISSGDKSEAEQFPTSIFENLLQNDELLRALFKPIDSNLAIGNINNNNSDKKEESTSKRTEKSKFL